MSDSDAGDDGSAAGGSDDGGIDKEALREELREKYEKDEREREATQRMSDLLLKGATMTSSHCGTCGDPLFQLNGTTFCPSCHGGPEGVEASVDEDGARAGQQGAAADATGTPAGEAPSSGAREDPAPGREEPTPGREDRTTGHENRATPADVAPGDSPARNGSAPSPDADGPSIDEGAADEGSTGPTRLGDPSDRSTAGAGPGDSSSSFTPSSRSRPSIPYDDGDLAAAREALVAACTRFSREAAETDDPRYARECLEAAREAGEALAVLR